jgi:thiol-disulfide isomerase/thioredoxin
MECPHCKGYVPENNYRCPACGKVVQPDEKPDDLRKPSIKGSHKNTNNGILVVILIGIAIFAFAVFFKGLKRAPQSEQTITNPQTSSGYNVDSTQPRKRINTNELAQVINANNPGEEIEIEKLLPIGKIVIFDFFSEYCPPCRQIGPLLKELDGKRDDIVVLKLDINRPGARGIDWQSPLIKQFGIQSIPHFIIYDSSGKQESVGESAYRRIMEYLQAEGISQ